MTLDPHDWGAAHATARRMVDDMLHWQETVRDRAPWQPVPQDVKDRLDEPVPHAGMPLDEVYDAFSSAFLGLGHGHRLPDGNAGRNVGCRHECPFGRL